MRGALTIAWRDVRAAFEGPLAYVLTAATLLVTGFLFLSQLGDYSDWSEQLREQASKNPEVLGYLDPNVMIVEPVLRATAAVLLILFSLYNVLR